MNKTYYPQLDETLYACRLSNGLEIRVVPRPGFTKKLSYLVTDFGSIHREFTLDGKEHTVPAGIAHFLEHKLFDMPGRDISAEFAALGAVPNAFTGYDMTAYHFSCTENFYKSLRLLLEFVYTPCFTQESVDKEQGIIGQEIDMNEDAPEVRIFEKLMQNMYENHPVQDPILGTRESIGTITPEMLTFCHKAFYRPENMLLCVVGDVDPEQVAAIAEELSPKANPKVTAVRSWQEKPLVQKPFESWQMEVAMPMFQLGFKCEVPGKGEQAARQEFLADLAAEALFGESSPLYLNMYQQGLIDSAFGGGFETIEGMALLTASGDSWEPEKVQSAILEEAARIVKEGVPEEDFLRMKRSSLGRRIKGLDSFDSTCYRVCAYHFSGYDYFRFPELYGDLTVRQLQDFLQKTVTEDNMSLAVIQEVKK